MYPMFSLWVRSHADLPLKTYQLVNTFRYETRQTRSFIRVREIHFFESHTCHDSFEDAEAQVSEDLEILAKLSKDLCIPYLLIKRPEWDKFPGAFYTIGIECLMPNGRTLQLGSIHQYKENFSRPFDIKYEDENGEHHFVHQTTYGMSERLLGAVIGVHGDDRGLVLPPNIASHQVVIVPILAKGRSSGVENEAEAIAAELKEAGLRVHLDMRDLRPGNKFYDWELKGVPLRIELGARDMEKGVATIATRDDLQKSEAPRDEIVEHVKIALDKVSERLLANATEVMKNNIQRAETLDDMKDIQGVIEAGWCGKESCAEQIEEFTGKAVLGTPWNDEDQQGKCAVCGADTLQLVYIAKTF